MIRTYTINNGQKPSEAQLQEVMKAKEHPITFDEDAPEMSSAMLKALKCAANQRNRRKAESTRRLVHPGALLIDPSYFFLRTIPMKLRYFPAPAPMDLRSPTA